MWVNLLTMICRRILLVLFGSALLERIFGKEIVDYILGDSVFSTILTAAVTGLLLLWSMRTKILVRVGLKAAIAMPPTSTLDAVREEVKATPTSEKLAVAFAPEAPEGKQ